jgi:hypothetical protein
MDPLSNIPVLLVTVCATPSLFVHVIVVPAETVIVEGLNAIPSIKTSFGPGPVPVPVEDFLQLFVTINIANKRKVTAKTLFLENVFFFMVMIYSEITK